MCACIGSSSGALVSEVGASSSQGHLYLNFPSFPSAVFSFSPYVTQICAINRLIDAS